MVEGDEPADEGDDEGDGDGGELDAQPAVGPRLACDPLGLLAAARGRARPGWMSRNSRSGSGSSSGRPLADVEGDLEAGAPVQRPRVAAELDPAGRRLAEMAEHHDRLAVLLDPVPQPGPLAQQRLVGELDGRHPGLGMAIEGEQSRLGPPVDGGVDGRVGDEAGQLGARGAPPRRLALGADDDEPLEHLPDRGPLVVVERGVEQLGPRGDRPVDPAELPVGGQCEPLVGAAFGQLVQRELQRRQRRRLVRRRR